MGDVVPFENDPSANAVRARMEASRWLVTLSEADAENPCHQNWRDWLSASPENREAWRCITHTDAMLRAVVQPDTVKTGWKNRVHQHKWRATALAAAAAIALLLAPQVMLRLQTDYLTTTAKTSIARLSDGSIAHLGPETALRVYYDGKARRVELLSGEASFDIRHDPARPFSVVSARATTTVLGTYFVVSDLGTGTMVTVARGHVRVTPTKTPSAKQNAQYELFPGDQMMIADDGQHERAHHAQAGWSIDPGARIAVSNRPVREVIERLRPWFHGQILLTSQKVGQARITGVFDADDPVRALQALVGPQGGFVTRITPWLLIVSPA